MQTVYILFGEMGAGKTYTAKKLAERLRARFFEGDDTLPAELREKVEAGLPLTKAEVSRFVRGPLADHVIAAAHKYALTPIIVSQALYSNADRLYLMKQLKMHGFDVIFSMIKVGFWQNLRQLWSRKGGLKWILCWLLAKPFFEQPTHHCIELTRDF